MLTKPSAKRASCKAKLKTCGNRHCGHLSVSTCPTSKEKSSSTVVDSRVATTERHHHMCKSMRNRGPLKNLTPPLFKSRTCSSVTLRKRSDLYHHESHMLLTEKWEPIGTYLIRHITTARSRNAKAEITKHAIDCWKFLNTFFPWMVQVQPYK